MPPNYYRLELERKYSQQLHNPLSDVKHVAAIKTAIDEKVWEYARKQEQNQRKLVDMYKKGML